MRTNNIRRQYKKISLMLIGFVFISVAARAQTTTISGIIKDAKTGETLPYVSIGIPGSTIGTSANDEGKYTLTFRGNYTAIKFGYIGYLPVSKKIVPGTAQVINVEMDVDASMLQEVVVTGKKKKYRNRDNPAVQLIRQVIAHKDSNQLKSQDYAQYQQYEKITFALSNLSEKFRDRKIFKNYQFLFKEQDSTDIGGRISLPAYMEEKVSKVYYRKSPQKTKQYVLADKRAQFDPKFIDNEGLSDYFNRLYENINIYDNNISLLTNMLLSPIAGSSPTFYKFYITDTIKTNSPWLVELSFIPRNKTDLLFEGRLYITLDGHYAVQHAYLTVNKDINLNFVRDMEAKLEFEKDSAGRYYLNRSTLGMEFALGEKGGGIFGRRVVDYSDYQTGIVQPDSMYKGAAVQLMFDPDIPQPESYIAGLRHMPLEASEQRIYHNVDTLQTIPSFRKVMDYSTLLLAGFKDFGKFEMGPVSTFWSFNPVEGFRLRFGGRTTPAMSKRFYLESYLAYGFKDERWKYFLSGTYSLNNKSIYHFPQQYIRASYQKDTQIPGQELQFVQEDNFLLSFKRGDNNRWLYNDIFKLEYMFEFQNHFSVNAGFKKWQQQPAGILAYQLPDGQGGLKTVPDLNTSELSVQLRYAPNEKFYQGKLYRIPVFNQYPIFTLSYTAGLKGFWEGEYAYHNLYGNIFKRTYLSQLGYADITAEGGYIAGNNIPFPLLSIAHANQTYAYQLNSYNLMNFMEFVSDHYAALNVQYYMNGFLFNKIPLFKRLKWREVFSFKGIWGGLRDENNPDYSDGVYRFQQDDHGRDISYTLDRGPYIEVSAGIMNIFKVLRMDAVKRLNYLDHPDVAEWGIRARFKVDF